MSAQLAFQTAVLAHLAADGGVQSLLGDPARVYDRAPAGAAYPFVTLGRSRSRPLDGDETRLGEHRLSLHVRTRRHDHGEVKDIAGAVAAALHNADLTLSAGYRLVLCQVVYTDHFEEAGTGSVHALVRVRALIQRI